MLKQVSTKQFVLIVFIISICAKLFLAPALLMRISRRDSWLTMIMFVLIEGVSLLFVLLTLRRNPDKTCFQIAEAAMGRVFSRILFAPLLIFAIFKCLLLIGEVNIFLSTSVFDDFNWPVMLAPLMLMLYLLCARSLKTIGRTAEIIGPLVIISLVLMAVLMFPKLIPKNIFPILEDGPATVMDSFFRYPVWFADVPFLVICLGNVKLNKKTLPASLIVYAVSILFMVGIPLVLYTTHAEVYYLVEYGHNASRLTGYFHGAQQFGRLDIILYFFWQMGIFISLAVMFYTAISVTDYMFAGKVKRSLLSAILLVALYALSVSVFNQTDLIYLFYTGIIRYIILPVPVLLPVILYVCSVLRYQPNPAPFQNITSRRGIQTHETNANPSKNKKNRHI